MIAFKDKNVDTKPKKKKIKHIHDEAGKGFKNPIERFKQAVKAKQPTKGKLVSTVSEKTDLWKLTNKERSQVIRMSYGSKRLEKKLKRESYFKDKKNEQASGNDSKILPIGQPSGE
jgi:hypothetical protein